MSYNLPKKFGKITPCDISLDPASVLKEVVKRTFSHKIERKQPFYDFTTNYSTEIRP